MKWEKLGNIFQVNNNSSWMCTHAAVPTAVQLEKDIFRIFFSTRDQHNVSHGAFFDFDLSNFKVVNVSREPVIGPGVLGLFDDSGVTLSCFVPELKTFYYMGWNLPKLVPFSNQIGSARFFDPELKTLQKHSVIPILGKTEKEPFSFGYPWVCKANGKFFMWYDANLTWKNNSTEDYVFPLRMAESEDGRAWKKNNINCLELREGERAIARPCVLNENDTFKMWYSVNRNGKYSLGYAESADGKAWIRKDAEMGLTTSSETWESQEVCYPYVFDHNSQRYLLYNGNSYGKTGIGLARLKTS